jgi:hypothetical protein
MSTDTAALDRIAQRQPGRIGQATAVEQSRAVAEVEAAVIVAQRMPRDVTRAQADMERSCAQHALAERAFFRYSRGGGQITGPSVQLARELARCFGNVQYGLVELRRDDAFGQSEMLAFAWDVQTNTRSSTAFIVPHKRDKRGGPEQLTDMRDIYENNANNGARRLREMIFAILPGWYTESAIAACYETLNGDDGELPQRVASCIDGYAKRGVTQTQLERKLGAPRSAWAAPDLATLQVIWRSLVRGEVTREAEFPAEQERVQASDIMGGDPAAAAPAEPAATQPRRPGKGELAAQFNAAGQDEPAPQDPDPAAHGSVSKEQTDALWANFTRLGFTKEERAAAREVCEKITGRKLLGGTTGNLSADEADQCLGVLGRFGERGDVVAFMATGEVPAGDEAPGA